MKPAQNSRLTLFTAGLLMASLSACVSLGGVKAPPALLLLSPENKMADGGSKSGAAKDAFVVLIPDAPRKIDTNRLPVQIDDSRIAYLKDAIWADKPVRLMQQLIAETIAAKNGRLVLNEVESGGKAEHMLSGSLVEFGIDARSMQAIIVFDAVRLDRGQIIEKRRFEAHESVNAIVATDAGGALNRAANKVATEVALWVG